MTNNQLIVEDRNVGKTTYLMNEIDKYILQNKFIIVLDSATEHEEKSLLKKVIKKYPDSEYINVIDKQKININEYLIGDYIKNYKNNFPYFELSSCKSNIICFDVSYFLEKGHEVYDKTKSIDCYKYYRKIYNDLSQQIVLMAILLEHNKIIKDVVVVMDEIELPIVNYEMDKLQDNIMFLASVHPENSFGTFYNSFEKIDFKKYIRKAKNI
ncbi:MAG: hypothetical protein J6K21_03305 [Bacilli bacterium]|nr:hypothetical protein [Bacilli bacterium]